MKRPNPLNTEIMTFVTGTQKSIEWGKCLETGKQQNPLHQQKRHAQGAPNDLLDV